MRVSEAAMYRKCRRAWKYRHLQGLVPAEENLGARSIGKVVHLLLAEYYRLFLGRASREIKAIAETKGFTEEHVTQWVLSLPEASPLDADQISLIVGMFLGYIEYAKWADRDWEVLGVEVPMRVPLRDGLYLEGTADLLVRTPQGVFWVDHKTYSVLPQEASLEFDSQLTAYCLLGEAAGIPTRGAIYNILLKKVPEPPEILADGTPTKNKSRLRATTSYLYRQALERLHLDLEEYEDILQWLEGISREYFVRHYLYKTQEQKRRHLEDLKNQAWEMYGLELPRYPSPGFECRFCDYSILCRIENDGGDLEYASTKLYRVEEANSEAPPEE